MREKPIANETAPTICCSSIIFMNKLLAFRAIEQPISRQSYQSFDFFVWTNQFLKSLTTFLLALMIYYISWDIPRGFAAFRLQVISTALKALISHCRLITHPQLLAYGCTYVSIRRLSFSEIHFLCLESNYAQNQTNARAKW